MTVWAQCYGDYISVVQGSYFYDSDDQTIQEKRFVYRTDNGEAVALEDLFQPGFDYAAAIKAALARDLAEETRHGLTIDELYQGMQWSVGEQGIEIWPPLENGAQHVTALYSDMGPENMVIFH